MFCTNCGSKIEDGSVFCPNCGAAVMSDESVETVQSEPVQAAPEAQEGFTLASTEEVPVKKKAPKWVLPTAIVAAAAVVVSVVVAIVTGGSARLSGPEHLQKAEGEALNEVVDSLTNVYGTALDAMGQTPSASAGVSLSVRPGESVLDLLEDQMAAELGAEVDLSWLSKVSVSLDASVQEDLQKLELGLLLSDTQILTVAMINDMEEELAYLGVPTLSDVFFEMDASEMNAALAQTQTVDLEGLPSEEAVNSLLKKYINIALGALEDVEKTKETVELDGLKQECYVLTLKLSQEDLLIVVNACLEEAVDDKELKSVVDAISDWYNETYSEMYEGYGYTWEEVDFYDDFQDTAEDMLDQMEDVLDEADSSTLIKLTSYVDKKDNIIGRELKVSDSDVKLSYLTVTQKGKFAFEADLGGATVEGSGTIKSNKLSGEYVLEVEGDEYLTLEVTDYDQKAMEDGYLNGTFKLIPNEDLMDQILREYSSYAVLADLALEISVTNSENDFAIVLDILGGDDSLLAVELKSGASANDDIRVPSDTVDITDEDELMEWLENADFTALLENLRDAGVSDELVDGLESLLTGSGSNSGAAAVPYSAA